MYMYNICQSDPLEFPLCSVEASSEVSAINIPLCAEYEDKS